jgi:hypothetical protein
MFDRGSVSIGHNHNRIYKQKMVEIVMGKKEGKRGQVTIFIILGIVIVVAILSFFFWIKPNYFSGRGAEVGFEGCVEDVVGQAIDKLQLSAGFIEPKFTYKYNNEELAYLCYTNEYYKTCTVQVPFLKNNFDQQMETYIRDGVDTCYASAVDNLRAQGYSVVNGVVDYDVLIEPGVVKVKIEAPTVVESRQTTKFEVKVNSPIYDMTMIATSILQFEAKYGDGDTDSMMAFYPDYIIRKIKRSEGTTLYFIEHRTLGNKFQFASKSLVWPAGYDF